jgi:glycosyltransferase involved in cell wall biosynthesis
MCFDAMGRKGLDMLVPAFRKVVDRFPDATLDLVGRFGTPKRLKLIQELIDRHGLKSSVRVVGAVENGELLRRLGSYAGFVLVSRNETFGMSYVEALLAGLPIIYSNGTGIDGYVDGIEGAIGVDPLSPQDIADGLMKLIGRQGELHDWLRAHRRLILKRFGPDDYLAVYNDDLTQIAQRAERSGS